MTDDVDVTVNVVCFDWCGLYDNRGMERKEKSCISGSWKYRSFYKCIIDFWLKLAMDFLFSTFLLNNIAKYPHIIVVLITLFNSSVMKCGMSAKKRKILHFLITKCTFVFDNITISSVHFTSILVKPKLLSFKMRQLFQALNFDKLFQQSVFWRTVKIRPY